ncbi:MAG TPA: helix-turn-helix domain-containing protein [Spirochaetia bacterium]|nr:helix-turn-helix domain-containing protein [Spirochaetia bacterium]
MQVMAQDPTNGILDFPKALGRWASETQGAPGEEARAGITDRFLRSLLERWGSRDRPPSAGPTEATLAAERIISDRSLRTVADAARALGLDVRGLQRLFQREVGIGPKELILRFRLQEAAERLLRQPDLRSSDLALDLGYFDQAHFIRDFKSVTGIPPEAYQRRQPQR